MTKAFPELTLVQSIVQSLSGKARIEQLASIPLPSWALKKQPREFPMYAMSLGSTRPDVPVFGITGGVHGLERIGTQVVLSYLVSMVERLSWDETLQRDLENMRIVFVPLVNPVGMYLERRSNGNGVDLMRNAPIDAEDEPSFMVCGQRVSPILPWYRGKLGEAMELENRVLCDFVKRESFQSPMSLWIDVHSGYGIKDRLWFPYAKSSKPFPKLPEVYALKKLLDRTYPYHVYQVEPQSSQYTTHGDVWDYLYEERMKAHIAGARGVSQEPFFLPLTLEMGSWMWIRKNPFQVFSFLGPFNPVKPHRKKRTLRRHLTLFDFLMRSLASHRGWAAPAGDLRAELLREASATWYE